MGGSLVHREQIGGVSLGCKKYNETKIMLKDKNSWTSLQVTTPEPTKNGITAQAYPLEVGK